jgi:hypothetical protein
MIRYISETTGGDVFVALHDLNGLWQHSFSAARSLSVLYTQMQATRQLALTLPIPVTKPEEWKLSLGKEKSRRLSGASVLYPRELLPCGAAEERPSQQD